MLRLAANHYKYAMRYVEIKKVISICFAKIYAKRPNTRWADRAAAMEKL